MHAFSSNDTVCQILDLKLQKMLKILWLICGNTAVCMDCTLACQVRRICYNVG